MIARGGNAGARESLAQTTSYSGFSLHSQGEIAVAEVLADPEGWQGPLPELIESVARDPRIDFATRLVCTRSLMQTGAPTDDTSDRRERRREAERGGPLSIDSLRRIVREAGEAAALDVEVHPHQLRHAAGYLSINEGHDLRGVQDFLGHNTGGPMGRPVSRAGLVWRLRAKPRTDTSGPHERTSQYRGPLV